jgi:hypothetical protein
VSYDLFFKRKKPPKAKQVFAWFRERANYQLNETQAFYSNDSTGVYFSFEVNDKDSSFNLNYFRPHIFGLEAEPEVRAYVEQFDYELEDPQMDGMGSGPYSKEGFLRGWNAGNDFAVRAIFSQNREDALAQIFTLPAKRIAALWRWNLGREARTGGIDVFVPRVSFGRVGDALKTFVVWPDSIPIFLPAVDLVVLMTPPEEEDGPPGMTLVEHKKLAPVLEHFLDATDELPYKRLVYDQAPPGLVAFVSKMKPVKGKLEAVPVDRVLDAELIAKHSG